MTRNSPLHEEHRRLGAKMTEFGGWLMPLQYKGVLVEHEAVRERVGLFDVSHLGKVTVGGVHAVDALDSWLPGRVAELAPWQASYNLVLNEEAGIIDDVFVYRTPDEFILIPNAGNTDRVLEEARRELRGANVEDAREDWGILALSGPRSREVVSLVAPEASDMKLHHFGPYSISGADVLVARTGYTGEVTFEFLVPWAEAMKLWEIVMAVGDRYEITPTGLGARDTLRLEMGYPLFGHEISEDVNPIESGLDWVIRWEKPNFKAKQVLEELRNDDTGRKLVGLVADGREIPRQGYPILLEGKEVGELTSGNFSPTLGRGIGLGYVPTKLSEEGTVVFVDVRGKLLPMTITRPPFVKST